MDRKGHPPHAKHENVVSGTVKGAVGLVGSLLPGHQTSSHTSHTSSSHGNVVSETVKGAVDLVGSLLPGHQTSSHTSHTSSSHGNVVSETVKGAVDLVGDILLGHQTSSHTSSCHQSSHQESGGHKVIHHVTVSESHHVHGHSKESEGHPDHRHVKVIEIHHGHGHAKPSEGHHVTTHDGSVSPQKALKVPEPIKVTSCIGGFYVLETREKVGFYQALQKKLVSEEVALALLEAQAATGHIIDPSTNQKLTVEAAIKQGIVGSEWEQKLLLASSAVTGYKDKDGTISLFQALKKGLVEKLDAVRFLQAQIATGGIINYLTGSKVPFSEALKLNYIDESLFKTITGPSEFSNCYPDPNTKEGSSYEELLSKCFIDSKTGLVFLTLQESLQGLRKAVNLEELLKANIITQAQFDEFGEGIISKQKLGELKGVRQYLGGLPSIGGIHVESTKENISIYQAWKRNFLSADCAVALLEAQAASGFIVDPEKGKTFTVTEAIQEGVVGFDLKEKLLNAERAVTGFNDPYTGKKISLFQAIRKELIDRNLGLSLLQVQLATGGIIDPFHSFHVPLQTAYKRGLIDESTAKLLSGPDRTIRGFIDPNTNDRVTYQELQSRSTSQPTPSTYFFRLKISFDGLRGKVTSDELLDSQVIDQTTYDNLQKGKLSVQDVAEQEQVKRYLQGTGLIAGVADISTNKIKTIYQAMKEHLLMQGTAIALLEAQASTGYLIDPIKNLKFSVKDAVKNGLIGPELYEKLLTAEKAATGYKDPSSGERLSLCQAIKRGFVLKDHGIHLLNAQLATGGILDPSKKHRVPTEVAYKRGLFDQDTNKILRSQTKDIKGFFDPNLKENVTYEQLIERSVIDVNSGLYLIPVYDGTQDAQKTADFFIDYKTKVALDGIKLKLTFGKFKGYVVSLWHIFFSECFSVELRLSFIKLYKAGTLSVEELSKKVEGEIKKAVSSTKVVFKGLRESVTPGQLLDSEIIDKNLYDRLQQGKASAKDVGKIDTVKKYLKGTGSIGGLILTDTQEKISIYQAKRKGFLRPGTSLILLEAQAATGYIIDPVNNKKYSVDEALKANIIGPEYYEKLLAAEKSVTGYKDPYTGEIISLFQAMSKDFIVEEHGIRLLEAQIATGGIIDPINSHRIPVDVAYKRGYFDKKMNLILSDPSDDTKGFFDPNTNENLTYLQLKEKCITEPSTNLCLLPLASKQRQFSFTDQIRDSLRNVEIFVRYGRFQGQTLSAWFLINSEYFSEDRRRELLEQYRVKRITIDELIMILEEDVKKLTEIRIPALRGQVNIYDLFEYEIIEKEVLDQVLEGKVTIEDVSKMDKVRKYLQGSGVLGGVIIQPSKKKVSFYEATKNNILLPSTVLPLLEAQAATGHIVDPANNQKLTVDEALKTAVVDPQIYERLALAEEAATGYKDPFSGNKISLFQAMKKGLIEEKHAKQLLEAQLATGGVIDPVHGFHLPDSVATKHGFLSEDLLKNLSQSTDDTKSFYDPITKEKVTYSELLSRSQKDESTGQYLLPLAQDFAEVPVTNLYSNEEVRKILTDARIETRKTTVWDLIHSGYFTEEQRFDFLERFKAKKITIVELTTEIVQIVKTLEIKRTTHINFQGLRGNVPVVWLLDLGIITQKTFDDLVQGVKSVEEVSKLPEVKKCLQGTGSISGVFLPSTKEKLTIYQALKKNILLPANATMLLEAQAATGFIVDPVKNGKYTVNNAIKAGLVGPELHQKLLTAERAVSGYTDPYTGNKISVGQAIQKKLIPEKDGIPLLQAQLATGGIIDPLHCHYVPLQVAYKLGFLDEEISKRAADQKIYIDPNTKETVTYEQLKEKCYTDPETGTLLVPLSETTGVHVEGHSLDAFKSFKITINTGRFKGQTVSLWELLNSEYISPDKLKEFLVKYKSSSSEALQEIIKTVTTIFEQTDATSTQIKFKGLRKQVSASDLFQSKVIDKKTLDELNLGKKTIDEVTKMDTVKRYLEGTNSIAGVLLQATNTKMSIYEAMLKGILRPGTALVLLEAQAATGFIIDPVKNEKMSVDEALEKGLIGSEVHAKLLSAEQAVTGYKDPYSGEKISLFQAMQKQLIVESHGIRLLEAQIATGGIIDPVNSHRVPVEVAYKRGYFNEEMNKILLDPSDDTKGFFDPNTHENLTYMQLVERCIQDPETGLYLLQVIKKGENYFYITEKMKTDLQSRTIKLKFGKYANQNVSIWELLNSHYIPDMKRRELVRLYTLGVLSIDQLISTITTIIEEYESKSSTFKLKGIKGDVSATDLYNADIIDRKTLSDLQEGKISLEAVSELDSVKKYLKGTGCIAGVLYQPTNETLSINEAMSRGILSRDIGLILLQAQAATGHLIDPIKNQVLSVIDAVSQGLVNADIQEPLKVAEKAATGYTDEKTGEKISLFQAIKKGIVPKDQGIPLLDAQLATGGVVDPVNSHRLPQHVAYQKDHLGEDLYLLISDSGKKGFVDPNTRERITYKNLLERCVKDPKTGLYLLPLTEKHDDYFYIDEATKKLLQETKVTMTSGKLNGQVISLWELLTSNYISEEKKKQLIKLYKTKTSSTLKDIGGVVTTAIDDKEKVQKDIWFQGLRKQVTAAELFDAKIINQETLDGLNKDLKTVNEVSKIDSIKRYLEGTSCIAGVIIPSKLDPTKKEKVNIYDAMLRQVLRPGTALILLEAQAATGFVIDCIQNRKLSVDEALAAGVIGYDIYEKLLSAEKGVTGYTDPYTGEKISLFQAMQKGLIVKHHGIRLLEAQIATGGIIDPVHSHRVPVEVAYKRGYFDEEMNQILSDPTDDTKGFFDPNTHENLTYLQLLQRCTQDPDTKLYMLELKDSKFSPAEIQNKLQSSIVQITVGELKGKSVSVWELINSKYFSAEKREELLKKFESGSITIEEILAMTIKVVNETEQTLTQVSTTTTTTTTTQADKTDGSDPQAKVQTWLQSKKVNVPVGDYMGKNVSVWELLNSHYISGDKRKELLEKIKSKTLTIQEIITIIITIITETETKVVQKIVQVPDEKLVEPEHLIPDEEIEKALKNISIRVTKGQYAGQEVSVWDLLNSQYIPENTKQELLEEYKLTIHDIMELVVLSIRETEEKIRTHYNLKVEIYNVLQTVQINITEGKFKGQKQSVWHILNSKYFSEKKRSELLEKFNSGTITIDELIKIIITIITETEEHSKKLQFKGLRRQVSATELLTSEIIDQDTMRELAQGQKTVEEVTKLDNVKRYLEGTSCIAGVLVPSPKDPSKKDKMNIYDAMLKNILRPGTALVLLEAQAATGFVIDSVKNKKLSVDEASAAGIIGHELHKKLLSAEKAVTGYTDPYTGDKISLFQAMQKDLIVKDHGIRLLEAQIATGGIIDPVHSHRVPVEVAYKRGYFDKEMNRILSDPTDDTKGFFDPNTHENLTYMQLLSRCVQDPDTGLYMLNMKDKQTILAEKALETSLQSIIIQIKVGQYGGKSVSAWELLQSQYFTEEKRQLLLNQYKSKTITVEELTSSIKSTVEGSVQQGSKQTVDEFSLKDADGKIPKEITKSHITTEKKDVFDVSLVPKIKPSQQPIAEEDNKALNAFTVHAQEFQDKRVSLWEVLHSKYLSDDSCISQLRKHQGAVAKLKQRVQTLIEDPKSKTKPDFQKTLELKLVDVNTGELKGQKVSLWSLLYSKDIIEEKRTELLEKYKLGSLTEDELLRIVITVIEETKQTQRVQVPKEIQQKLQTKLTKVDVGEFKGQDVSLWSLLYSKYITEEKRTELLEKYKLGSITEDKLLTILITIIEETVQTQQVQVPKEIQQKLQTKLTKVDVGEFKGQNVSLWSLLYSKYITEDKRTELLEKYKLGSMTDDQFLSIVINIIEETEKSPKVKSEKDIQQELEQKLTKVTVGEFKGQSVSVWFLLYSKYITEEKRNELLGKYKSGTLKSEELLNIILTIIEKTETKGELKFKGLRRQVTASELRNSEIIDQNTLNDLTQGNKTVEEVTQMDSVKRYLEGSSGIAGVFVESKTDPSKREKLTIYNAMSKRILRPGTALILLEAQAASGFMIDPIQNKKLSVDEALAAGLIGHEIYDKLLSAEKAVTGYNDPYTGEKISLFQAMKKDLIVRNHGIRLLEAQIATGGIIDPIYSHRVPVEVAYKRGYFDEEMNQILLDPSDDTKGFFDPNTHENLTYLQLLQRCIQDPETGLYMLDVNRNKVPSTQTEKENILKTKTIRLPQFQGKDVTIWEILQSDFISTEKREELLKGYYSQTVTFDEFIALLSRTVLESPLVAGKADSADKVTLLQSEMVDVSVGDFKGKRVSVWDLLNSNYITKEKQTELLEKYTNGILTIDDLGIILLTTITKFHTEGIFPGSAREIQVQVPAKPSVQEGDIQKALQSINIHVKKGEFAGQEVSMWDLLNSRYTTQEKRQELLGNYRLTLEEIILLVIQTIEDVDYKGSLSYFKVAYNLKEETVSALQTIQIEVTEGEYKGQKQSVWYLLNSKYFSKEKRRELLERFNSGVLNVDELTKAITTIIQETEERSKSLKFKGLRRQVTASELLTSEIIDQGTLRELAQGQKTVEQVTKLDSVKRYLEGTSCIAGVLVPSSKDPSKKDKMSIYDAMLKNILRPGTALVLLEAQAATGFVIDPVNNKKLSVDEAAAARLIGLEVQAKLLSAEKAVTGYTDPYTNEKISLFQAMQKDLIVKDHGIRLLEAQIATGGIIDPVYSHRVPVEVAYKRGYFDEEMNRILSDPTDDTKGFFDPNTHENLTYLQLLSRCVQDPDTGLYMLIMKDKQTILAEKALETSLQSITIQIKVGQYGGKSVSAWELLQSKYFTEEQRQLLLNQFKSKTITVDELISRITSTIAGWEQKHGNQSVNGFSLDEAVQDINKENKKSILQNTLVEIGRGKLQGKKLSVWDLLNSDYIEANKREEILQKYFSGVLTIEEIIRTITVIITEVKDKEFSIQKVTVPKTEQTVKISTDEYQNALNIIMVNLKTSDLQEQKISLWNVLHSSYIPEDKRNDQLIKHKLTVENLKQIITTLIDDSETKKDADIQQALSTKPHEVAVGELKGQTVSVWFLLNSKYITEEKRKELLQKYKSGTVTDEEIYQIIITIIEESEKTQQVQVPKEIQQKLETKLTKVDVGELQGQNVSLWFLLNSKYITGEKRTELLEKYKLGSLTEDELLRIVITVIEETKQTQQVQVPKEIQQKLETKLTKVDVGEFKGQNVSLWSLLNSKCITGEKRTELLEKYKLGSMTDAEFLTILVTIIDETVQTQQVQVPKEIQQKLQTKLTKVDVGEFKGQTVSLWSLLNSKYITGEKRTELLEKYKLGSITDDQFWTILITIIEETVESAEDDRDKEIQQELKQKLTKVTVGEFKGQSVSVWFLLYSKYITEEKRNELLEKYKSGTLKFEELLNIILTTIEETETKRELKFKGLRRQVTASELRNSEIIDQNTLNDLRQGNKTVEEVTQMDSVKRYLEGSSGIAGVFVESKTDPSKREKLTIYNAMTKRILRRGTALILLEAQAASGFMIDPIQNKKLSVDEALAAGLIGHEIYDKLLSAEKAVTGYNDPYTEEKISLFQAMKKDLIVKNHGIRLLEAQIATGGIIDPIYSHRVPVEVAYKRGYFDEEMNQILSDPSDDTKGFFDPNTHENLTYLQLLQRCIQDPETGLYMLDVKSGTPAPQEELKVKSDLQSKTVHISVGDFQEKNVSVWDLLYSRYITAEKQQELLKKYRAGTVTIEELITILITMITEADKDEKLPPEIKAIKKSFLSVKIEISIGEFHEKSMSLWDLLHSKYIPEDKQEELIQKYNSGTVSIQEIINIVLSMIQKQVQTTKTKTVVVQEKKIISDGTEHWPSEGQVQKALEVIPIDLSRKLDATNNISVWAFLHGQGFPEDTRNALLQTYTSSVREVMSTCTGLIKGTVTEAVSAGEEKQKELPKESGQNQKRVETQNSLQAVEVDVTVGNQATTKNSLWDLLHASYVTSAKRDELLAGYESGTLGLQDLVKTIMQLLMETEKSSVKVAIRQTVPVKTKQFSLESIPEPVTKSLQVFTVSMSSAEFTGENNSLWDLIQSKTISNAMRLDLLGGYLFTITTIITMMTGSSSKTVTAVTKKPDTETFLKSVRVQVDIGEFKLKGESHSLWDLLHSEYITEEKRNELIHQYESGAITWEQIFNAITAIIKETEEKTHHIKFQD